MPDLPLRRRKTETMTSGKCRGCIHQGYCIERHERGPCAEYEVEQRRKPEYLYWWKECHWWELKDRKRTSDESNGD